MTTLRRYWLRSYPWIIATWLFLANRVLALDTTHTSTRKPDPQPSAAPAPEPTKPTKPTKPIRAKVSFETENGIQLIAANVPPGDSVLRVQASDEARAVTAFFSFGAIYQLVRDEDGTTWASKVEVPRELPDGEHTLSVRIIDKSGLVHWRDAEYKIDGSAPELAIDVDEYAWPGDSLHVTVEPLEPVRRIYITLPGVRKERVELKRDAETGLYEGKIRVPLELPQDQLKLRVVARDRARNQTQVDVMVPVTLDGC